MKNSKVVKVYLILAGLLLTFVGASILFTPVEFTAKNGIDLGGNVSLLNDIRSSGGLYLAMGVTIILGGFVSRLVFISTLTSIITYLAVGAGRAMSIVLEGMPAEGLVKATIAEFVVGLIGVFIFIKYQEK